MSIAGIPVVGVPVPVAAPTDSSGTIMANTAPQPDFGPAAVFTPSTFDAATLLNLYNRAGVAVPLTHWLRSGDVPAPSAELGTDKV